MKIKYLGTAAFEGVPSVFCECEVCKKTRELGRRNIRTRSQAIIDDTVLIEFPPDSYIHGLMYGIDLTKIHTCLVTHDHSDHFYPDDLVVRTPGLATVQETDVLHIYGTKPVVDHFLRKMRALYRTPGKYVDAIEIKPFESFEAEGYKVTPLRADHYPDPLFYVIEKNGKTMMYAHDTGYFPEETWEYIEQMDVVFDFVSLDCTSGILPGAKPEGHMQLEGCTNVRQRLLKMERCDEHTIFCLNHFSHNGKVTYDELVPLAREQGFEVSYDGMEIEF